ncbi:MAG: hypothetical protein IJJ48_02285 [Firmicutes bacterium]|nr:hypothetical protein [Bacillota bacterium]
MKKLLALLLALVMLFACACDGGKNGSKDDRYDAIKPGDEEAVTLYDSTLNQTLTLTKVTTESREDASDLLDVIYAYLESLGISAKVKSLYTIPFGLAGNWNEYLPVKVFFEDESVSPIYVIVLKDGTKYTAGLTAMASFRDADVANSEYFNKTLSCIDNWEALLKEALGFQGSDKSIFFPITMTRDLAFATPSDNDKKLYEETNSRYYKYMLALWYDDMGESVQINGLWYQPLNRDDIKSRDDLREYLAGVFTEKNVEGIKASRPELESGDYPVYYEYDGKLYVAGIGMGGPEDLESVELKYVAQQRDYLFFIVEATRADRNWNSSTDSWETTNRHYQEFMYIYEKPVDSWLCDYYTDISFGFYETIM